MLTRREQHWRGQRQVPDGISRLSSTILHLPTCHQRQDRDFNVLLLLLVLLGGRTYYNFSTMQHLAYALQLL